MEAPTSPIDLMQTLAEPTRLRIMNCLAAAPLFVSDLQEVLALPQSTVSRHLQVLRRAALVRDTPVTPFVIYRLRHPDGATGRLLNALLEAVGVLEPMAGERSRAQQRSRADYFDRVSHEAADAPRDDDQQAPEGGPA